MALNNFRLVTLVLFTSSAALGVLFAIPLWMGKIGPNPWTGFRNAKTLADADLWFYVNGIMGMEMFFLNIFILVLTMVFHFSNIVKNPVVPPVILTLVLVLGYSVIGLHCWKIAAQA